MHMCVLVCAPMHIYTVSIMECATLRHLIIVNRLCAFFSCLCFRWNFFFLTKIKTHWIPLDNLLPPINTTNCTNSVFLTIKKNAHAHLVNVDGNNLDTYCISTGKKCVSVSQSLKLFLLRFFFPSFCIVSFSKHFKSNGLLPTDFN